MEHRAPLGAPARGRRLRTTTARPPTRRLAFAYLTNLLLPGHDGARHQAAVSDAVLAGQAGGH